MLLRATPEQTWCSGGFLADQWQATSLRDETRWVPCGCGGLRRREPRRRSHATGGFE